MSQTGKSLTSTERDREALEVLVVGNPDLEQLEALLDQFNIFEAIGAVRQELRHSDFLAFLLNPQQNHRLGDAFVKRLLQKALIAAQGASIPVSPIDLDVWSLDELVIQREWQNIDIMILDEAHSLAIIIENKISGGEHSGQLKRYRHTVEQHYPDWCIIGLYLTPDGDPASDDSYLPIGYDLVAELVDRLAESRASTLGPDVRTLMIHYTQMLRRHIVAQSEIAELCQRIYHKHQRALDLIYEYRPDLQAAIREVLKHLIEETPGFIQDYSTKTYILFLPEDWDVPALRRGEGWTPSGLMLLFQFENAPTSLKLKLIVGPGPQEIRQKLYQMALSSSVLKAYKALGSKWNTIFVRSFLKSEHYEGPSINELEPEIRKRWGQFLENDLPKIKRAVRAEEWIWETGSEGECV